MKLRVTLFCSVLMVSLSLISGRTPLISSSRATAPESATPSPSPTPTASVINSKFVVTAAQVRQTFDEFELKGEKQSKVSIGTEQSLAVTATSAAGPKSLTLSVRFLSPLDQAARFGYEIGLVAKNLTPDYRKDFEDRMVARIVKQCEQAAFVVKLLPVPDPELSLPTVSFVLVDVAGANISPTTEPHDYSAAPQDLLTQVSLEKDGQELVFPTTADSGPRITNSMDKMTLIVGVDGQSRSLQYSLK